MSAVEVDQRIKIEQTNRDTIIAFSNDFSRAIVIPSQVKKCLKARFRKAGKPHFFYYRTFAAGVALLLKKHPHKIGKVIIDTEYTGRERVIRAMILEMLACLGCREPIIEFREIGRISNAHHVTYSTMKRKRVPDGILALRELEELIFLQNKKTRVFVRAE